VSDETRRLAEQLFRSAITVEQERRRFRAPGEDLHTDDAVETEENGLLWSSVTDEGTLTEWAQWSIRAAEVFSAEWNRLHPKPE
jgi:hypothetical protein